MAGQIGIVTGSTAGAIMGQNKYLTPMNAWMRLLGLSEPVLDNEFMRWGRDLEPVLAKRYHEDTGNILFPSIELGLDFERPVMHPTIPWWGGTADRLIIDDPKLCTKNIDVAYKRMAKPSFWKHVHGIWEAKTAGAGMRKAWDNGEVPPSYYLQVCWYMPVYRVEWADISVLIGGQDWRTVSIHRNLELEQAMHDKVKEFIEKYVIPQEPPPVDDSPAWSAYLSKLFPTQMGAIETATAEEFETAMWLRSIRESLAELSAKESKAINTLKGYIGDRRGVSGKGWYVTWANNKPSIKTDWKAVFEMLRARNLDMTSFPTQQEIDDLVKQFTVEVPGARVFRASFNDKEVGDVS